ncbi:MAG: DUF4105 domain-containing protein [Gemmatimonadaceae bacterium]
MRLRTLLRTAALALGLAAPVEAQVTTPAPVSSRPGSEITVTLVTFGLGQEVFERFGHNGLRFQDAITGEDDFYHWGLFSFEAPDFLARFLTGDNKYWMGREAGLARIDYERRAGRPITLQKLNLTPTQAFALRDFVRWNAREEHKFYRYDYFRDNCSTRLRDALDQALHGALRAATEPKLTDITYRNESLRLTDGDKPVQAGIDIALGRPADVPITLWQSFFIPMRLRDAIRTVKNHDDNGAEMPLVASEMQVPLTPDASPVPELSSPPTLIWRYLMLGLLLAALVVILRIMMLSRRSAAWGLALLGAGWSLLCGVIGVILLLAWMATRHVFWASNENVLLLTPFSLFLVVLVPASILSNRFARPARMLAGFVAALGLLALVLALIPGGESNGAVVAMMLPVHLALAWALGLPRTLSARRA